MRKLNLCFIVSLLFIASNIFAQDMYGPPSPVQSPYIDASLGTWVSEPYQFMGRSITDEVTQKMILNGQFMEINVKGQSEGFTYEGMGIISISSDGSVSGTFYDVFGKTMNYSGTSNGSNISLTGSNNWVSETRNISIEGNTMIHNISIAMKDASGNEMAPQKVVIKYKKK